MVVALVVYVKCQIALATNSALLFILSITNTFLVVIIMPQIGNCFRHRLMVFAGKFKL